jgi:predicted RNA binding protein YcfA (HicA-like mRNA interferase family)
MAKPSKLLERLLAGSYNIGFNEFVTLLEAFGFVPDRIKGSHHIYVQADVGKLLSIQPRKDGKAKPYQLRQFLKLIEEYDLDLKDSER